MSTPKNQEIENPVEHITQQGQAMAQALRAFQVLEPNARWFERLLIRILRFEYRRRLRYLVAVLPPDVAEEIINPRR